MVCMPAHVFVVCLPISLCLHLYFLSLQNGLLQLFDLQAGVLLESVAGHTEAVWSLSLAPDNVRLHCLFTIPVLFRRYSIGFLCAGSHGVTRNMRYDHRGNRVHHIQTKDHGAILDFGFSSFVQFTLTSSVWLLMTS